MKIINDGDYAGQPYNVDQDTTVNGGDWVGAKVATNGHRLVLSGGDFFGAEIDGDLTPDRWPENVQVHVPVPSVVVHGQFSFKTLDLDRDLIVLGGNYTCARVVDNGHRLDRRGGNWAGWWLNGAKQDPYVWRDMGKWEKIKAFQQVLQSKGAGEDAWDAWVWTVDYLQASPTADRATFLGDYEAQDFVAYQGFILKTVEALFGISGYEAVRNAINGQPRERLVGEDTEILEERD